MPDAGPVHDRRQAFPPPASSAVAVFNYMARTKEMPDTSGVCAPRSGEARNAVRSTSLFDVVNRALRGFQREVLQLLEGAEDCAPARAEPLTMSKRNNRHSIGPFHIGTRRLSFRRIAVGSFMSGLSTQAVQPL